MSRILAAVALTLCITFVASCSQPPTAPTREDVRSFDGRCDTTGGQTCHGTQPWY